MDSTVKPPSPIVRTTFARNVLLIACAASAGVHAELVPSHVEENLSLGLAFAVSAGLLFALVVLLVSASQPRRSAALAAAVLVALMVAYSLSTTVGLPPLEEHVEPLDAVGLLTQGVQLAGLAAAVFLYQPPGGATARANRREAP